MGKKDFQVKHKKILYVAICLEVLLFLIIFWKIESSSNFFHRYVSRADTEASLEYGKCLDLVDELKIDQTIQCLKEIIVRHPNFGRAHGELGFLYETKGHEQESMEEYRLALRDKKHGDQLGFVYGNIGEIYLKQKKYDDAISYLKEAILRRQPQGHIGYYYRDLGLAYRGKQEESFVRAERNMMAELNNGSTDREKVTLFMDLSDLHRDWKKFDKALDYVRQAEEMMPVFSDWSWFSAFRDYHSSRAEIYARQGNFSAALVEANKSIEINPNIVDGYYWKAIASLFRGDVSMAISLQQKLKDFHMQYAETLAGRIKLFIDSPDRVRLLQQEFIES